jgi:hypothetical protein
MKLVEVVKVHWPRAGLARLLVEARQPVGVVALVVLLAITAQA